MDKTVYFLGAGFSKDAGGPIQNGIITTILSEEFAREPSLNGYVLTARESFINFLKDDLSISEDSFDAVALEDVFTPIDRCIAHGRSFQKYDVKSLVNLREEFHSLMGAAIKFGVDKFDHDKRYIDDFAKHLNKLALEKIGQYKVDKVAVITTNWDILLDNSLDEILRKYSVTEESAGSRKLAVVDYCCYISSLEDDDYIKPGLLALGRGGYNVKYLKLHGSMNWLHCPGCQRMFVKFREKTIFGQEKFCKHCKENYNEGDIEALKLKGNLLLPTFLKDLSNIQIQLVWQNAGIELAEASKVVFIGYSLPAADFEIRQLLSRCIPKHTKVEVVLYPNNPNMEEEKARYKTFFGSRIKADSFIEMKVPDYVSGLS